MAPERSKPYEWQRYANLPIDGEIGNDTWDSIVNKLRDLQIVTNIPVAKQLLLPQLWCAGISILKCRNI